MSVAVIRFPGSNCENESIDALKSHDISFDLIDWTASTNLDNYSGFLLPGGFSYQDRIRAGVIAAKLPIIQQLKKQATQNKPILGICNGAQILVESGLLTSSHALDQIIDLNYVDDHAIGFISDWGFLTPFNASHNVFLSSFSDNDVLPIQICHGEGRFLTQSPPISGLKYTSIAGQITGEFPTTPNGSPDNIAAISNPDGNILAIMPHPERSILHTRMPYAIQTYAQKHRLNLINISSLFNAFKGCAA